MASFVLKDASFVLDSVDLSDHVIQIAVNRSKDVPQNTAMGDDDHTYLAEGLRDADLTVTFKQDFAAGSVDATVNGVYEGSAAVTAVIKPKSDAVGSTNPSFTCSVICTDYSPIDGSIGDVATTSPTFKVTGGVTRATE